MENDLFEWSYLELFFIEDLKNKFKLAFIPNMINFYDITGEE